MKIDKITMAGFRGATLPVDLVFDKSKIVTLIFGENGSGKSTVADAFDFLCNRSYGSLENYSLGEPPKRYVSSFNSSPGALRVALTAGSSTWTATLGTAGPVIRPQQACPDARILRRKTILKLIEAQPRQRFEELKVFITVPNIDKAESSLRDAVRISDAALNESTRALAQAQEALHKLWTEEGKASESAMAWAELEIAKNVSELQDTVGKIDRLLTAFNAVITKSESLVRARTAEDSARDALKLAEEKQKEAEKQQVQQNAELLQLLEKARAYVEKRQQFDECPVCERDMKAEDLLRSLITRIGDMKDLKTFVDLVSKATQDLQAKIAVVKEAQKQFCQAVKDIGNLLKSETLTEVTSLKVNWQKYNDFFSNTDVSDQTEQLARALWADVVQCQASLQHRRDADQKSVNLHNAVRGHCETSQAKRAQAKSQEVLLKQLKLALDITSRERKDYVEGILAGISGEVERLYLLVHPGEGIGGIRFSLKPNAIGSLEFDGDFQGTSEVPPQAYYSESHLDTLGICVFLALTKFFKTDKTIVVLDDVLTSVDASHLDRFIRLLHDEAVNFNQFIVTTHYRPWRERYRWAKGPAANTQLIELGPWTLQNGLRVAAFVTAIAELRTTLAEKQFDGQSVASKAGIILESLLDFLTLKYRCRVPRNARNEYTLGDLANAIDSKLGKELKSQTNSGSGGAKTETQLKPLIDSATSQPWVRNSAGAHFSSLGTEITDTEVRTFGDDVLKLAEAMICCQCETLPTRRPSGSFWQCRCGDTELFPLVQPGADPSTVDDDA